MALSYFSFDKVMSELNIEEDELKRLVSEGQIRAYRDEDKMKFRKDDIEQLRSSIEPSGGAEPTIILPAGQLDDEDGELDSDGEEIMLVEEDTAETILDLDGLGVDDDFEDDEQTSIPTVDFNTDDLDDDDGAESLTEELVFDEDADLGGGDDDDLFGGATQKIDSQATIIDDDDDIDISTSPLDDNMGATVVDSDPVDLGDEEDARPRSRGRSVRRVSMAPKAPPVSPMWTALSVFTLIFTAWGALVGWDIAASEASDFTEIPAGVVGGMLDMRDPITGQPVEYRKMYQERQRGSVDVTELRKIENFLGNDSYEGNEDASAVAWWDKTYGADATSAFADDIRANPTTAGLPEGTSE